MGAEPVVVLYASISGNKITGILLIGLIVRVCVCVCVNKLLCLIDCILV